MSRRNIQLGPRNGVCAVAASLFALFVLAMPGLSCRRAPPTNVTKDGLHVNASLSTNTICIGDQVSLSLSIDHPKDGRLEVPDLNNDKKIVAREIAHDVVHEGDREQTRLDYSITSFELGVQTVSTGMVRFVQTNGVSLEQPFPIVSFTVESLLTDTNEPLRDIKDLVDWPRPPVTRVLIVIAFIALLILFALAAWLFLRKGKMTARIAAPTPPPHEIALRALQALLDKHWIEDGNVVPFYVELSNIVRSYIEARFNLRAPEQTTEEFIREASISRLLTPDHQQLIADFLEQCDLVKFARYEPGRETMRAAYHAAERLIRETIPSPPPLSVSS